RLFWRDRDRARRARAADAARIAEIVADAVDISAGTAGVSTWAGRWSGLSVQVGTIVDTLATRKLPACWLSVSITERVAVDAVFDMMMRPGSATTFSNFDLLPHAQRPFHGLPQEAVVRSDSRNARMPVETISRHLGIFADPRAKELLITPK